MSRKLIGQSMLEAKLINQNQLDQLLAHQKKAVERIPLGKLTIELGILKEEEFVPFLASYFDVPYLDLGEYVLIQKEALQMIPEAIAKRYNVLPLVKEDDTLTVAMSDPLDLTTLENLEKVTNCHINQVISMPSKIKESINTVYKTSVEEN